MARLGGAQTFKEPYIEHGPTDVRDSGYVGKVILLVEMYVNAKLTDNRPLASPG